METLEQPKVDVKKIQEAANAAAEKAYLRAIDEYYNSYDSPYRNMVKAELEKQQFSYSMDIPDILTQINAGITAEVDRLANTAVANTYLPLVSEMLVRIDKKMKLSDLFKLVIEEVYDKEDEDPTDYEFLIETHSEYKWQSCFLRTPEHTYDFTLHTSIYKPKPNEPVTYHLLSMPRTDKKEYGKTMKIIKDDISIEMPFTANILHDKVLMLFAKMILSDTQITLDCDGFDEDMFPTNECECY